MCFVNQSYDDILDVLSQSCMEPDLVAVVASIQVAVFCMFNLCVIQVEVGFESGNFVFTQERRCLRQSLRCTYGQRRSGGWEKSGAIDFSHTIHAL